MSGHGGGSEFELLGQPTVAFRGLV